MPKVPLQNCVYTWRPYKFADRSIYTVETRYECRAVRQKRFHFHFHERSILLRMHAYFEASPAAVRARACVYVCVCMCAGPYKIKNGPSRIRFTSITSVASSHRGLGGGGGGLRFSHKSSG